MPTQPLSARCVYAGLRLGSAASLSISREVDLLELVLLVVDDRADERRGRHRALHADLLDVAHQLEIRFRLDRRRAGVRDLERDVDHVAAAMERQRLHDLVAVGGGRLQLHLQRVGARRKRARAGQRPRRRSGGWASLRRSGRPARRTCARRCAAARDTASSDPARPDACRARRARSSPPTVSMSAT